MTAGLLGVALALAGGQTGVWAQTRRGYFISVAVGAFHWYMHDYTAFTDAYILHM